MVNDERNLMGGLHYGGTKATLRMGRDIHRTACHYRRPRIWANVLHPHIARNERRSAVQLHSSGLLGTGNFVGYLLMAIIGGFLAARIGTRIVIALALVLMGITMVLTGLAETFAFAFSMRLLTGLGNGAAYVPAMALGSAWFAIERRGFATGIVSAGIGGGTMISGLIVPAILGACGVEGWRFAWLYLGGAVLVIAGIAALFIRSRPEEMGLRQVGGSRAVVLAPTSSGSVGALEWGRVYGLGRVWYLGAVYFCTVSLTSFT